LSSFRDRGGGCPLYVGPEAAAASVGRQIGLRPSSLARRPSGCHQVVVRSRGEVPAGPARPMAQAAGGVLRLANRNQRRCGVVRRQSVQKLLGPRQLATPRSPVGRRLRLGAGRAGQRRGRVQTARPWSRTRGRRRLRATSN